MTLDELQEQSLIWTKRNFPKAKPFEPLIGVQEEVGELAHAWLKRHQGIRGTYDEHTEKMTDAVGDIVIFLADFCNKNGLNLHNCVKSAWNDASKRDWRKYPKNGLKE